jgi:hypothetical protein
MSRERSMLPPRLRDWREGQPQVGVFLRTRQGSTVQLVNDAGTAVQEDLALALIVSSRIPAEVLRPLREWVAMNVVGPSVRVKEEESGG